MQMNAVDSEFLEGTLHDWMSECRSEEHIRAWQSASWTVYLIVTGTVAPALWAGLAIGIPAALTLAWTALEWNRAVRHRRQAQFEAAFISAIATESIMADVMSDRGTFWRNSILASAAASSGISAGLDDHVRESLQEDLAQVLQFEANRIHASEDHTGLVLHSLAGTGLLITFQTASDPGSIAVALVAAFWLAGLVAMDFLVRKRRIRRNTLLTPLVDEGSRWLNSWIRRVVQHTSSPSRPFRRTEHYRRLPWVR